ncbi:hypothetical protein Ddye_012911 [Dipteronia dyeriana]|uniref:Uncharacterized protein n=1 Tax=Dipteronia dyeriana TaxID=168575 RepID=A0AAD9X574_9ROSI|nr:hypothetical protein Ddye_012911 [Dipteronia dyeriana]
MSTVSLQRQLCRPLPLLFRWCIFGCSISIIDLELIVEGDGHQLHKAIEVLSEMK